MEIKDLDFLRKMWAKAYGNNTFTSKEIEEWDELLNSEMFHARR